MLDVNEIYKVKFDNVLRIVQIYNYRMMVMICRIEFFENSEMVYFSNDSKRGL